MARTGSSEHLRYRYGICLNDKCPKCKSKEIQQIAARKDFVCGECGKELRECPPPKGFIQKYGKLIAIIGGAVVAVAAVVGVVLNSSGSKLPESIDLNKATLTLEVGKSEQLKVHEIDEGVELVWEATSSENPSAAEVSADGTVTAKHKGKATIRVSLAEKDDVFASCEVTVEPKEMEESRGDSLITDPQQTDPQPAEPQKEEPTNDKGNGGNEGGSQPTTRSVFGGKAVYSPSAATITIKKTMTLDLHTSDNETITLHAGDKIIGVKVNGGYLIQGELVSGGESQLLTGLRNKL